MRVVTISDFHCGSKVGLTPPGYQNDSLQGELWDAYLMMLEPLRPIDILVANGDLIDGKGYRWGGTDLITADRAEQAEMATICIEVTEAKEAYLTYGTPYHTGRSEDWEGEVAKYLGVPIEDQLWLDVNGVVFDVKHFIGASSVPYGRHTTIARDRLWNLLWAEMGQQPKADILLRSHVHYHNYCGGVSWVAMTTPALQGLGSKFGARYPAGTVDFGLVYFDIDDDGGFTWQSDTILIENQMSTPYIVGGEDESQEEPTQDSS